MRKRVWLRVCRAAVFAAAMSVGCEAAWAQLLKPNVYPVTKDSLQLFELARPAESDETLHDWRISAGYQQSGLDGNAVGQRERRDFSTATVGLSARIGARGLAGLDLTRTDQSLDLRNGVVPIRGDVDEHGIRAYGSYMLLPYLAVGGSLGRNDLDGIYRFGAMPQDQSSGAMTSYGAFAALLFPLGDWKFSLTGAYSFDEAWQSFADGAPREQQARLRVGSAVLAALHPILPRLDGMASLASHHIIDYKAFLPGRAMDEDWLRPTIGLIWRMTDQVSAVLSASTFAMNEVYDYESVSLGLSYKF